ncbi:MAG: fumarylacetoacetate hydrolase family protein [Nocardioides sp.]|uniref:2-keto-4-pentenoate hydratase n=1 Tax=Nocardioides sp. TaxID=35761 RepID=UPI0039E719AA
MREAANRLIGADREGAPCAPVRDLLGWDDLEGAYAVQRMVCDERVARGARIVGWRIGVGPGAGGRLFAGALFDDTAYVGGDTVPRDVLRQPRVGVEVALVLGRDLDHGELGLLQVRAAVDYAVTALDISGSRIVDWDVSLVDLVADNAASGPFVLGPLRRPLGEAGIGEVAGRLEIDGAKVGGAFSFAPVIDPLEGLRWLARHVRGLGSPLRAGQIVLSGPLGPVVPVEPGARIAASVTGLGRVVATLG